MLKNAPTIARNTGDCVGSIPVLGSSLQKEMPTHSSILAWRITWTEEPTTLQSMGSQSQTLLSTHTHTQTHAKDTDYATCSFYTGKDCNLHPMKHRENDTTALSGESIVT